MLKLHVFSFMAFSFCLSAFLPACLPAYLSADIFCPCDSVATVQDAVTKVYVGIEMMAEFLRWVH